jgi:hypothetical protein
MEVPEGVVPTPPSGLGIGRSDAVVGPSEPINPTAAPNGKKRVMKRIWILLMVVALAVAIAAPATAAKPDCDLDPYHPSCKPADEDPSDDGPIGMTCAEAALAGPKNPAFRHVEVHWTSAQSFWVELNDQRNACVDVASGAGEWVIEVESLGSASGVQLAVQDSVNPGDACWGGCNGDLEAIVTPADCDAAEGEQCKVLTPMLPASDLDACGIWVADNGFADGDPQLAFNASYSGVKKMAEPVRIKVSFPEVSSP